VGNLLIRRWSDDDRLALKRLNAGREPVQLIARKLRRTESSVRSTLKLYIPSRTSKNRETRGGQPASAASPTETLCWQQNRGRESLSLGRWRSSRSSKSFCTEGSLWRALPSIFGGAKTASWWSSATSGCRRPSNWSSAWPKQAPASYTEQGKDWSWEAGNVCSGSSFHGFLRRGLAVHTPIGSFRPALPARVTWKTLSATPKAQERVAKVIAEKALIGDTEEGRPLK